MHTQPVPSIQAVKRAVFRADKEKAKGYSYVLRLCPPWMCGSGKAQAQHLCHNQKITDARELKEASARFVTLKASTCPKSKVTKVVV